MESPTRREPLFSIVEISSRSGQTALRKIEQLSLESVDGVERLFPGIANELLLERIDPVAEGFQNDEIMIDDGIQQGVGQVIRAELPDAALAVSDPFANRIEHVARSLLERQDEIPAEHQAQLFGDELPALAAELDHPGDEIERGFEVVQLGALGRRHDVFQNQGVEAESLSQFFDDVRIVDAVDVDPRHGGSQVERQTLLEGRDFLLEEMPVVVIDQGDARPVDFPPADMDEASGTETAFLGTRRRIPGHPLPPPAVPPPLLFPGKSRLSGFAVRTSFPEPGPASVRRGLFPPPPAGRDRLSGGYRRPIRPPGRCFP